MATGVIGFLLSWVQAYGKVGNTRKRSQQLVVLQPWWFLNSQLLPAKHEHIRFRAKLFCTVLNGFTNFMVDWSVSQKASNRTMGNNRRQSTLWMARLAGANRFCVFAVYQHVKIDLPPGPRLHILHTPLIHMDILNIERL